MNESPAFFAIEDYEAWLRIAKVTNLFVRIPKSLGAYRIHSGNIGKINSFKYLSNALSDYLNELDKNQLHRFQSLYIYQIARKKFSEKLRGESWPFLIFVLRYGRLEYRLKSLLMSVNNLQKGVFPKVIDFKSNLLISEILRNE